MQYSVQFSHNSGPIMDELEFVFGSRDGHGPRKISGDR